MKSNENKRSILVTITIVIILLAVIIFGCVELFGSQETRTVLHSAIIKILYFIVVIAVILILVVIVGGIIYLRHGGKKKPSSLASDVKTSVDISKPKDSSDKDKKGFLSSLSENFNRLHLNWKYVGFGAIGLVILFIMIHMFSGSENSRESALSETSSDSTKKYIVTMDTIKKQVSEPEKSLTESSNQSTKSGGFFSWLGGLFGGEEKRSTDSEKSLTAKSKSDTTNNNARQKIPSSATTDWTPNQPSVTTAPPKQTIVWDAIQGNQDEQKKMENELINGDPSWKTKDWNDEKPVHE